MKLVHLITPKQAKAANNATPATINDKLRERKLENPKADKKPTPLRWLAEINKALRFGSVRSVRQHRK